MGIRLSIYNFDPEDAKRFGQEQHIKYQQRGDELQFKYCPYCRNRTTPSQSISGPASLNACVLLAEQKAT